MSLRFQTRQPARRSMFSGTGLRLVSLVMGLGLVLVLMQVAQSPGTIEKLGLLFGDASPAPPPAASDQLAAPLPMVEASLLETIEDNTTFRDEETEAWFHLLEVAQQSTNEQLATASVGELAYAQLVNQPDVYRGRPVRIEGNARRVETITPAENEMGFDRLYRVIIQPGRDVLRPFTLYCVELPAGWSTGDALPNEGRLACDALFFKNWVYNNQPGVDLSPVFVSRSFAPVLAEPTLVDRTPAMPAWQIVGLAGLAAAVVVMWIARRNGEIQRQQYAAECSQVVEELNRLADDLHSS